MALPPRQQRFIQEYLIDLNATQAAIRAGYSAPTARHQASRLLTKAGVQAAIAVAQQDRAQRVGLTHDAVLHELALLAQSDITDYTFDAHGDVVVRPGAPAGALRAISSLKKRIIQTETATVVETEIRLWNKPAALKMAGEHLGVLKGAEPTLPDIHIHIELARERLTERLSHLAQRHVEDAVNGS